MMPPRFLFNTDLTSSMNTPLSYVLVDSFVTTVDDNNRIVSH